MSEEIEVVRGSGNVFRDFGYADADIEQLKAQLAAEIVRVLDKKELSVRKAEKLTGIAAADISRIRNATLNRFTIDRLVKLLSRLNFKVSFKVSRLTKKEENERIAASA